METQPDSLQQISGESQKGIRLMGMKKGEIYILCL